MKNIFFLITDESTLI